MIPGPADHLLAVLIAVAYPLYSTLEWFRGLRKELETGGARSRLRFYRRSMIELWLLTALTLSWWVGSGRAARSIGIGLPGGWAFWIGGIVVLALSAALGYQVAVVRASAEARAQVRTQLRGVPALMLPRSNHESWLWVALSLTAGVCEEILYRGYLIWYVMTWLPGAASVLVSAIVFGVAHVYLGWGTGVLRATLMGVLLGAAYLLTGTLWVPIVLHAVVDVTSGLTGAAALAHRELDAHQGQAGDTESR